MKIVLIGCLFLVSCATLRKAKPVDNQVPLTKENITLLNGEYEIFSTTDTKSSLDESLLFNKYWWKDSDNRCSYTLTLKALDKQRLQVGVYKSGDLIKSKKIHYKIRHGALRFNRIMFKSIVIVNVCGAMHTRLRVNTAGELIIDHSHSSMGGFLIIPSAGENIKEEGIVFQKRR
ncbi:hypothetical protein A4H97_10575 [Niastella yeongjuensis]|uniref:Lipocalin-like domain-containing protein n=1 Tax=Niastella yeongjuensis TaxID=354355 RepID=A0A1V9EF94_9BACT|nr:hypothetical protein [Niastella yeongjuensis]OQP44798.1 hypothetical protein A4H97_10575 [Niastella yeongjuensis]SEP42339.1 hypothetical protein SAMN05660816_05984 [Niastella yeongjuensis]